MRTLWRAEYLAKKPRQFGVSGLFCIRVVEFYEAGTMLNSANVAKLWPLCSLLTTIFR